jgi:HAMP domain-containing protein
MKNLSIRTKIVAGVLGVMLIGAVCIAVYLHQTFSGGLAVVGRDSLSIAKGAWDDITTHSAAKPGFAEYAKSAATLVDRMKKISGADYGLLLAKSAGDQKSYAAARAALNLPDNWSEGETYVLAASSDEALSGKMQMKTAPDGVPEIGKIVGIENGACSKMCHGSVKGQGDFWGVSWSSDSHSRVHAVIPVIGADAKPIGLLYTIDDVTVQANADRSSLVNTLLVILFGLACATVLISVLLDLFIFKRLTKMTAAMEDLGVRVAGGDFDAHFQPDGTGDEIGRFEEFFAKFVDLTNSMLKSLLNKKS